MTETELSGVTCRHSGPRIVTRREKEMFFFTAIGKIFLKTRDVSQCKNVIILPISWLTDPQCSLGSGRTKSMRNHENLDPYPEAHSQYRIRMKPTKIDADPGGSGCEFTKMILNMPFVGCRTVHLLADDCLNCGS